VTRRVAYALVVAAAVLPRLAVLAHERGAILASYAEKSDRFAYTFVHSGTFGFVPGEPSAYTQPLYGWFLIPIYWIFGREWAAVGIAQIVVAACTAALVYTIALRFLSSRWALVAAVVATWNPYLIWHDVHVNREILDQLLAAAMVLLTLQLAERGPEWRRLVLLGLVSGLAMLGNTRLFALPVVLVAFLLWRWRLGRQALAGATVVLACAAIAVAPWLIRNRVVIGCFALTTDGRALWKANNAQTYSILAHGGWIDDVPRSPGSPWNPEEAAALYPTRIVHVNECKQMSYYENLAFTYWTDHPGGKARLMAQAAGMLWSPKVTETTGRNRAGGLDFGRRVVAPAYTIAIYALALLGVFFVPLELAVLGVLLLAYDTVAALAFAGATRYRVTWDFLLVLAAAAGVAWLVERVRVRQRAIA
jgi:4-amino-4-deoxy-L-arabinose transferase-like glycosyltransferase